MFIFFLLLLSAIALTISAMSGQRQRIVFQAIEGGSEALVMHILLLPLVVMLIITVGGPWPIFMSISGFYAVIPLLYVLLRSLSLRRQQRWTHLKVLVAGNILIVLSIYLIIWWVQSLPWEDVFPT